MRGICIYSICQNQSASLVAFMKFYCYMTLHAYAFLPPVIKGSCFQNVQGLTVFKLLFSLMLKSNERNVYTFHLPESKCKLGGFYEILLLNYTTHTFLPPIIKGSCFQTVQGLTVFKLIFSFNGKQIRVLSFYPQGFTCIIFSF